MFVDLGGVDGLVHSYHRPILESYQPPPSEILELDQKLNVVILDFDDDKSRIQLGLEAIECAPMGSKLSPIPLKKETESNGKVVVIADYGAFIEIEEGVEGLVHVSEMSWSTHLRSAQDFVKVGDEVDAVYTYPWIVNPEKCLWVIKQLTPDPWTDITSKYPIGSNTQGLLETSPTLAYLLS